MPITLQAQGQILSVAINRDTHQRRFWRDVTIARFGKNYTQKLHSRASLMPNKIVGLSCVYGHRNMTMVSARLFLTPLAARASVAFLDTDTYNLADRRYHLPSNPCVCNKWRRIPASPGARFGARFGAWQARAGILPRASRREF